MRLSLRTSVIIVVLLLVTGCKTALNLPNSMLASNSSQVPSQGLCLKPHTPSEQHYYASGSANSLEKAKQRAREDLAAQISSQISVKSQSSDKLLNGKANSKFEQHATLISAAIPLDKHRIVDQCHSHGRYFVALQLDKASLKNAITHRYHRSREDSKKLLARRNQYSPYEAFLAHYQAQELLAALNTYQPFLTAPATELPPLLTALSQFVDDHKKLAIRVQTNEVLQPLKPLLEQALQAEQLHYQSHQGVATLSLSGKPLARVMNQRFFVKLKTELTFRRDDTGELLKRISLPAVNASSSLSQEAALISAQELAKQQLLKILKKANKSLTHLLGFSS